MTRSNPYSVTMEVLRKTEKNGAYLNIALHHSLNRACLSERDGYLVTDLCNGIIRQRLTLDYLWNRMIDRGFKKIQPAMVDLLRIGIYRLKYHSVNSPGFIHALLEVAKGYVSQGAVGMLNAVFRRFLLEMDAIPWPDAHEKPADYLSVYYSQPLWLVKRWLARFGFDAAASLCSFNNTKPPLVVRINTFKIALEKACGYFKDKGIDFEISPYFCDALRITGHWNPAEDPAFRDGWFYLQDESSMLPAYILKPKPGEYVIDLCAAPGGKTAYLAQLMENRGKIDAWDIHPHKLQLLRENMIRMGFSIVNPVLGDAREISAQTLQADGIILDAPCSGTGVLRRRADARWRKQPGDLEKLTELQRELLDRAAKVLKPGGRLVYSTCSLEPEENDMQIKNFMYRNPEFTELPLNPEFPPAWAEKMPEVQGCYYILPQQWNVDGFFIALLKKQVIAGEIGTSRNKSPNPGKEA